jgi:hypothetical protein
MTKKSVFFVAQKQPKSMDSNKKFKGIIVRLVVDIVQKRKGLIANQVLMNNYIFGKQTMK